jgi:phospholipase C
MRNRINSVLYAALLVAASLAFTQSVLAQNSPAKFQQIQHVIVIYQENWSFDSLYGLFPGANGLLQSSNTSLTQLDRLTAQPYSSQVGQPFDLVSGSVSLTTPPQPINNNVKPNVVDNRFDPNLNVSILKTIELIFGLDPLNSYDANASSLASSLK